MQTSQPELSVIVIAHNMPRQAMNTLYSLSSHFQQGVAETDYEVLVVENESGANLDPAAVAALGSNFHYRLRSEAGVSPAPAINWALARCRGRHVGLLIDGARMVTPRVLKYALQALRTPGAVVAVPGYYLSIEGSKEGDAAAILAHEKDLLAAMDWKNDGYQLFRQACFSNGNRWGYMEPLMECNALFCARELLLSLGGADERFTLRGGGALNLHLYRQLATAPGTELFMLAGEGNFHQFHGGTSTTAGEERDALVKTFKQQLDELWPGGFKGVRREPTLLGAVGRFALPFLQTSLQSTAGRHERFAADGRDPWEDEPEKLYAK
jgi:glycosyltransferase involved in cell wall biosynthesis